MAALSVPVLFARARAARARSVELRIRALSECLCARERGRIPRARAARSSNRAARRGLVLVPDDRSGLDWHEPDAELESVLVVVEPRG